MRSRLDLALYAVHLVFWGVFGVTRMIAARAPDRGAAVPTVSPVATESARTAPFSRALLAIHMLAFGVMYFGIAQAVLPRLVPAWFSGQRLVATSIIALGAALMSWSLVYLRSWRFRAKLDQGHELATGGPFRWVRNPIYLGLNLLALGTAVWVPTVIVWGAVALMILGSDLRARAEERLLDEGFGEAYRAYRARSRRFVPGLY